MSESESITILERTMLERKREISLDSLREAIRLKCANCYSAMSFANILGGSDTDAWYLCHNYSLKKLIETALAKGVDLDTLSSSIDNIPIKDSLYYKRAMGVMTEEEFQRAFRKWKNGD